MKNSPSTTDQRLLTAYVAESVKRQHEEILLKLTFVQACGLVAQLQLALKHPLNNGPAADLAHFAITSLQAAIHPGPAVAELFRQGAAYETKS